MRNVVLGLGISIDGYIARPDGAVDFLFMPKDYSMAPFFATIDTAIMGRKTYDAALAMGGAVGGSAMATYVCSRSLPSGERGGVTVTARTPAALSSSRTSSSRRCARSRRRRRSRSSPPSATSSSSR
jgi:dihydrofolate reductase